MKIPEQTDQNNRNLLTITDKQLTNLLNAYAYMIFSYSLLIEVTLAQDEIVPDEDVVTLLDAGRTQRCLTISDNFTT